LSGSGWNASEELSGGELVNDFLVLVSVGSAGSDFLGPWLTVLGISSGLFGFLDLLLVEFNVVVGEVPCAERVGINLDDSVLNEGLGTDQLIVSGVVDGIDDSALLGDGFGTPWEVTVIESKSSGLDVSTTSSNLDGSLFSDFGGRRDSSHLELSLFLMDGHATTGSSSLLSGVSSNTHTFLINNKIKNCI
jgi:hypothetical protein